MHYKERILTEEDDSWDMLFNFILPIWRVAGWTGIGVKAAPIGFFDDGGGCGLLKDSTAHPMQT